MKIINADLLDQEGIIAHQVNAQGVMGAGLALQIRRRWPDVYDLYRRWCERYGAPGKTFLAMAERGVWVANVCGQVGYGPGLQTDYHLLSHALADLYDQAVWLWNGNPHPPLYFPFGMGCGLAGGDWATVEPIIFTYFPNAVICRRHVDA